MPKFLNLSLAGDSGIEYQDQSSFFCSFLGRKEPKELQKRQRSRKGKSPKKQKNTEMNSLISVFFCFSGQGTVGAAVGFN